MNLRGCTVSVRRPERSLGTPVRPGGMRAPALHSRPPCARRDVPRPAMSLREALEPPRLRTADDRCASAFLPLARALDRRARAAARAGDARVGLDHHRPARPGAGQRVAAAGRRHATARRSTPRPARCTWRWSRSASGRGDEVVTTTYTFAAVRQRDRARRRDAGAGRRRARHAVHRPARGRGARSRRARSAVMPVDYARPSVRHRRAAARSPGRAASRWSRTPPTRSARAWRGRPGRLARRPSPRSRSTPPRTSPPAKAARRSPTTTQLAERMRLLSLHGMNRDAWKRYTRHRLVVLRGDRARLQVQPERRAGGDRHRPARALRRARSGGRARAGRALPRGGSPSVPEVRAPGRARRASTHAWHLYPIALELERLTLRPRALHHGAAGGEHRHLGALHPDPPAPALPRHARRSRAGASRSPRTPTGGRSRCRCSRT